MAKTKGAYARRTTEVKAHQSSERRDECRYSNAPTESKRWVSIKGRTAPINAMPAPSLRHQLTSQCQRFHDVEGTRSAIINGIISGKVTAPNEILRTHAKAIVEAAKAKGLVIAPTCSKILIGCVKLKVK